MTAAFAAIVACNRSPAPPAPNPNRSEGGVGDAALSSAIFPAQAPRIDPACTALQVVGDVHAGTGHEPLAVLKGGPVPWPAWVELGPGARLEVDSVRSAQDLVFLGPAIVEPCTRGEERASLLSGRVESVLAQGTANAEEWIVTPFSVVRYERAALVITAAADRATVELSAGDAAAFGDGDSAFSPIAPGVPSTWSGAPIDLAGATAAVTLCESLVTEARSLDVLAVREPGPAHDERVRSAHIRARARCAIAGLRVAALRAAAVPAPSEASGHLMLRMDNLGGL